MKPKLQRIYYFIFILTSACFSNLQAQDIVTYSPDIYAKVDSVYPSNEVIQVANFDNFDVDPGDIVMIYQVKGATHDDPLSSFVDSKPISETVIYPNQAGSYEFFIIAEIDFGNKLVTTTRPLLYEYDDGEYIQLVKSSFYFGDAVVNSDIEVEPWDPINGIGGIFPIIVYQKLTLNADISADGSGFKGGALDTDDISRLCNHEGEHFYLNTDVAKAANKGEGHVTHKLSWTRGPGFIGSGGGGGVGKYAGGAGGGNWGWGGQSGGQVSECDTGSFVSFINNGGYVNKDDFYNLNNPYAANKILFGGGGGAGIGENELSGRPWATAGASGGGIIIILCDSLQANGGKLSAQGESVEDVSEAGGGGGGAGGTILIDARALTGDLTVDITGGNGGDVENSSICAGPGGGGGGGILWHAWNSIPVNIQLNADGGSGGDQPSGCLNLGWSGDAGSSLGKLRAPLNGFYFNKIIGDDEICGGQRPDTIRGTVPKGGNGDFDFKWEFSHDSINWEEDTIAGIGDSINFKPGILYDTTYFRRLVTYNAITDTSLPVRIDVWPIIEDNLSQTNSQVICELDFGEMIKANQPRGGDDNFSFHWEKSVNLTDWEIIESDTTLTTLVPGQLDITTYYRRYIQSVVVCQDYSDTITITVQPGLENYDILKDMQSCQGFDADTLVGLPGITGGNMSDYYYTWQMKGESGGWSDWGNDTTISYLLPGVLSDTSFFRRITTSGKCIDTSNTVKIEVLVPLSNNIIYGDDKICYGDEALEITNNGAVDGGNLVDYDFFWETGPNTNNWELDEQRSATFLPGHLYDTILIRRIVNSSACWDTSNYVTIRVVPEIINRLISPDTTICYSFYPDLFDEDVPTGGNGIYSYKWKQKQDDGWEDAAGSNTDYFYQSPGLFDTTLYYRVVESDICKRISDTITITVLPPISDNIIDESPISYTCFEIQKLITAKDPFGGDNSYLFQWEKSLDAESWSASIADNEEVDYLTPELQDSIYYRRIVFSGNYKQCKDTSDNVLLRINPLPVGDLAYLDTAVCDGESIPFGYTFTGTAPWVVHFSDKTSYNDVADPNSFILKNFVGSDVFYQDSISIDSLRDGNNCKATDELLSGFVKVKSYEVPSPNITNAANVCGDSAGVIAETPKFPAYWLGENLSFADSANNTTEVRSAVYDIPMTLIWHEQNNFCSNEDTADMVFFKIPQLETNFNDTITIYNISHYELKTPEPEYDSVTWIAIDDLTITSSGATFANLAGLDEFGKLYQLAYRIDNGVCFVTDTLAIEVSKISVPNVFTPNGDGINDRFYIEGLEEEGICKLTIINPWGNLVFQSEHTYEIEDELNYWDGRDENNNSLPDGTYYYILETEKGVNRKGFIVIKGSKVNGN